MLGWESNRIAAYENMVADIRALIHDHVWEPSEVNQEFMGKLLAIMDTASRPQVEHVESTLDAPPSSPSGRHRTEAKVVARWLWDRDLTPEQVEGKVKDALQELGLSHDDSASILPLAAELLEKQTARALANPDDPKFERRKMDDRDRWLTSRAAEPALGESSHGGNQASSSTQPGSSPTDPFRHGTVATSNRKAKAKLLARWLWDRGIDGPAVLGFTDKYRRIIAREAGVNPPSTLETWEVAADLMAKMEIKLEADPRLPAVQRHHLQEHSQWATDPHG